MAHQERTCSAQWHPCSLHIGAHCRSRWYGVGCWPDAQQAQKRLMNHFALLQTLLLKIQPHVKLVCYIMVSKQFEQVCRVWAGSVRNGSEGQEFQPESLVHWIFEGVPAGQHCGHRRDCLFEVGQRTRCAIQDASSRGSPNSESQFAALEKSATDVSHIGIGEISGGLKPSRRNIEEEGNVGAFVACAKRDYCFKPRGDFESCWCPWSFWWRCVGLDPWSKSGDVCGCRFLCREVALLKVMIITFLLRLPSFSVNRIVKRAS